MGFEIWKTTNLREKMKTMTKSILIGALAMTTQVFGERCNSQKNIVETAVAAGSFKTLAAALGAADLVAPLQGEGPFTVFAPTDEAFAKLPKGTVESLLKPENKSKLQAILKFHVLAGKVDLSAALSAKSAATLQGDHVRIGFANGKVSVNNASLITADIKASNGVIHVIDSVLLPPEPKNDIVNVAKKAGQFNTLLAAVDAAGLGGALSGKGPFTVFAPTDAAFQALPKGTVESLLEPGNKNKLKDILTFHVVSGKVSAGDALNAVSAKALNDGGLNFGIKNGVLNVNGVKIVKTDIAADNGVIHVIDAVLLPPAGPSSRASISPTERIEMAIEKGVPIFNKGDHAKCAEIYMDCVQNLVGDSHLDEQARQRMTAIASRAGKVHCKTTKSWMLRGALDHAYASMIR
jgi:uncharacterized surface protein with fasciclin (FAS1) repeats